MSGRRPEEISENIADAREQGKKKKQKPRRRGVNDSVGRSERGMRVELERDAIRAPFFYMTPGGEVQH